MQSLSVCARNAGNVPAGLITLHRAAGDQVDKHATGLTGALAAQSVRIATIVLLTSVLPNARMSAIDKDPSACKLACHIVKQQFHDICEVNLLTVITPSLAGGCCTVTPPVRLHCRQRVEHC